MYLREGEYMKWRGKEIIINNLKTFFERDASLRMGVRLQNDEQEVSQTIFILLAWPHYGICVSKQL